MSLGSLGSTQLGLSHPPKPRVRAVFLGPPGDSPFFQRPSDKSPKSAFQKPSHDKEVGSSPSLPHHQSSPPDPQLSLSVEAGCGSRGRQATSRVAFFKGGSVCVQLGLCGLVTFMPSHILQGGDSCSLSHLVQTSCFEAPVCP